MHYILSLSGIECNTHVCLIIRSSASIVRLDFRTSYNRFYIQNQDISNSSATFSIYLQQPLDWKYGCVMEKSILLPRSHCWKIMRKLQSLIKHNIFATSCRQIVHTRHLTLYACLYAKMIVGVAEQTVFWNGKWNITNDDRKNKINNSHNNQSKTEIEQIGLNTLPSMLLPIAFVSL